MLCLISPAPSREWLAVEAGREERQHKAGDWGMECSSEEAIGSEQPVRGPRGGIVGSLRPVSGDVLSRPGGRAGVRAMALGTYLIVRTRYIARRQVAGHDVCRGRPASLDVNIWDDEEGSLFLEVRAATIHGYLLSAGIVSGAMW